MVCWLVVVSGFWTIVWVCLVVVVSIRIPYSLVFAQVTTKFCRSSLCTDRLHRTDCIQTGGSTTGVQIVSGQFLVSTVIVHYVWNDSTLCM